MTKMNKSNKIGVVILIFIMALIGCKDESISKYSVPKRPVGAEEKATPAHQENEAIKSSGISQPNAVSLAWQLPSGWQEKQPGRMALASFDVVVGDATAECVVSKFPGDVGGLVANINRWRGQIGLASLDDAAAIASAETFTTSFGKIYYLKLDNASAQKAMLTAILPGDNFVVFVKMMPPSNLVAQLEASFVSFTKSITLK
jgi:hypothetical protein